MQVKDWKCANKNMSEITVILGRQLSKTHMKYNYKILFKISVVKQKWFPMKIMIISFHLIQGNM